ncbi:unnamed protein product [Heterobilharzia americana]|nr:unnamed protein product [Heterobilharzia americana]CAH8500217.1 unnamed protein product [Heterobilharzia americana]CAH8500233.1 unnamed protein product [Heterobilharzia americana]
MSKKYENDSVVVCAWDRSVVTPFVMRVAVGYTKGLVGVYTFKPSEVSSASSFSQLARFYAHERDICSVVWRTSTSDSLVNSSELLTSARDLVVKVWDVSILECCFSTKVPGQSHHHSSESGRHTNQKKNVTGAPWIVACYTIGNHSSGDVLFSGFRGELFHWRCGETPISLSIKDQGHSMLVFSIQYLLNSPGLVITISQDRNLIIWQLLEGSSPTVVLRFPTLSAGVSSLAQSAFSNSPLVAGLSDGSILFWKIYSLDMCSDRNSFDHQSKDKYISISPRGSQSSAITALSWHPLPQYENIIAYGTESGCVEIVDVNKLQKIQNQKPKPQLCAFGSTVYRVTWGPLLFTGLSSRKGNKSEKTADENDLKCENQNVPVNTTTHENEKVNDQRESSTRFPFYLYSISKGKIYCHFGSSRAPVDISTKFPSPPDTTIEDWKTLIRSDISFRSVSKTNSLAVDPIADTFDCLVSVGYLSGQVDVYGFSQSKIASDEQASEQLVFVCRIVNHSKCVNCLAWSREYYWLAIASNEFFITISDLKIQLTSAVNQEQYCKPVQLSTCLARLEGHYNRITCLDWSPHDPFLLLSCSFDGTANVWSIHPDNIEKNSLSISNFRAHRSRLFTCLWSRQDPDLVFSGGELCHLFGWQPSKQLFNQPPQSRRYRPPTIKKPVNSQEIIYNGDVSCENPSTTIESLHDSKLSEEKELEQEVMVSAGYVSSVVSQKEKPILLDCNSSQKINSNRKPEKRKRPALFPNLFQFSNSKHCELDLNHSPPIHLGSFLSQILNVSDFIMERMNNEKLQIDLLVLIPEVSITRTCLLKYLKMEASNHLELFQTGQRPNSLVHLDAYCILLLWIGYVPMIASIISSENHMPFWLLYAVQLAQSTFAYPQYCSELVSSEENSSSVEIDLLGEKIKDMQTTSPDVLIAATLLVCGHRVQEAVELLLRYDKIKEALILARIRLNPSESWKYTEKCIIRLIERSCSNEKSFYSIIYNIGKKEWLNASNIINREMKISNLLLLPGKEIDQLSWCWINISLLLNTSPLYYDYLSNECLHLSSICLTIGFRLFSTEPIFFQRWSEAFSRLLSSEMISCSGLISSLMLLDIGQIICFHMANYHDELSIETDRIYKIHNNNHNNWMKYINHDCIKCLDHLIINRQPSSVWEICLTNFCVDFLLFYLIHNHILPSKLIPNNDTLTLYTDRYETSRKSCEYIKPKETAYLISHLFSNYQKVISK